MGDLEPLQTSSPSCQRSKTEASPEHYVEKPPSVPAQDVAHIPSNYFLLVHYSNFNFIPHNIHGSVINLTYTLHSSNLHNVSPLLRFKSLSTTASTQSYSAVESHWQLQWPAKVVYGQLGSSSNTELAWSQRPYRNGVHEHGRAFNY